MILWITLFYTLILLSIFICFYLWTIFYTIFSLCLYCIWLVWKTIICTNFMFYLFCSITNSGIKFTLIITYFVITPINWTSIFSITLFYTFILLDKFIWELFWTIRYTILSIFLYFILIITCTTFYTLFLWFLYRI